MVESKYAGVVYEVKKKLAFYAKMDVLKMDEFIADEGTCSDNKAAETKWEGRSEVVKGRPHAGIFDFLENEERLILVCPVLYTICHGFLFRVKAA